MAHRVEISPRPHLRDTRGEALLAQIRDLGIEGVEAVSVSDLYFLDGNINPAALDAIIQNLLLDDVVEQANARPLGSPSEPLPEGTYAVEVAPLVGVTDSVAETLMEGARLLDIESLRRASTGTRYVLEGTVSEKLLRRIASALLSNEIVQTFAIDEPVPPPFTPTGAADASVEVVPLTKADDDGLLHISQTRRLSLDLAEMKAIQAHYQARDTEPNEIELEMLAQTWSEHCVHKTFKARIDYSEIDSQGQPIEGSASHVDSLLDDFIRAATDACGKPWIRSAFVDNAGIVAFDEDWDLAIKAETHNHPSALEPFGGANTGVGGVVRDILGVSARPIANTDVLCFGPQDLPFDALPEGVLHPRRIASGVIDGIEDYGNKMGIPTVAGAIHYGAGYTANPLVFVGCLGILPTGSHPTEPQKGDFVVCFGGRTGRDGLRGATFSSMEMTHDTGQVAGSAVQIGHPIHEKQTLEVIVEARDEKLYTAITDCGAGGLSSAVGEMGEKLGAEVHLERVPLKYSGLRPWEIWLSEAQERMVVAIPPANWDRFQTICNVHGVEATNLGHFTGDGRLTLRYEGEEVCGIDTHFLHDGIPRRHLQAVWQRPDTDNPAFPTNEDASATLLSLLGSPNIRSREEIIRRYDHEVQGGTVCKPLVGIGADAPGNATVLAPLQTHKTGSRLGVALGIGVNPNYAPVDPYRMAWAAVDEAMRNCVAVGADPDYVALLDNFCWGNPKLPDRLGGLVQASRGCYDAAVAFRAPFVSGKDSLNNEYADIEGQRHAIPGTILIHAMARVPDVAHTTTTDLKAAGNALYLLGETLGELGGSAYLQHHGLSGGEAPRPVSDPLVGYRALFSAIQSGLVAACHDCSEGGIATAIAEMAIGGRRGAHLDLAALPRPEGLDHGPALAFCESSGRLLIEVAPNCAEAFEALFTNLPLAKVGTVDEGDRLVLTDTDGLTLIDVTVSELTGAFKG